MAKPKPITILDDDENEIRLPTRWEICEDCLGEGERALHGIAITGEEWNGPDWDDDSREAYMRGDYDTPCEDCGGSGKVRVVDEERIPVEHREIYEKYEREQAELHAAEASDRRAREQGWY